MNIDGLDSAYGLGQVNDDQLRYRRLLQSFFDNNLTTARKIQEAFTGTSSREALRLATELQIAAESLGACVIARDAGSLAFAIENEWPSSMIKQQIDVMDLKLRTLLEDIRWFL